MTDLTDFSSNAPFSFDKEKKSELLTERLIYLSKQHYQNCEEYKRVIDGLQWNLDECETYYQIPFLPVGLFKEKNLNSILEEDVFKIMTSSGTTGQAVSKIYLDRLTAANQQKALVKIVSDFTGEARMPMLIIDSPSIMKNRSMFSARAAGILGFSIFGSKKAYALDDEMNLDIKAIQMFLEEHQGKSILLFGFTFMIWQYFYKELKKLNLTIDLSKGILIHGGGWKKLAEEAVEPEAFKQQLNDVCGIQKVYDYYGMVEQTGSIYMECEYGHLHCSNFSDVIIRRARDFSVCSFGEPGIIQVVSSLPESYPGHSILTEDEGVVLGEDDCPCKRLGKYFKVYGRIKSAEIRGCSDTYEK